MSITSDDDDDMAEEMEQPNVAIYEALAEVSDENKDTPIGQKRFRRNLIDKLIYYYRIGNLTQDDELFSKFVEDAEEYKSNFPSVTNETSFRHVLSQNKEALKAEIAKFEEQNDEMETDREDNTDDDDDGNSDDDRPVKRRRPRRQENDSGFSAPYVPVHPRFPNQYATTLPSNYGR